MKIRTEFVHPPIPDRNSDWCAVDDDTYEPGCPIGWGRTEADAIADLMMLIEDDAPESPNSCASVGGSDGTHFR